MRYTFIHTYLCVTNALYIYTYIPIFVYITSTYTHIRVNVCNHACICIHLYIFDVCVPLPIFHMLIKKLDDRHDDYHLLLYHIWQFPLKMLQSRNPLNRETQLPRCLAVQIQIEISFSFSLFRGFWVSWFRRFRGCSIFNGIYHIYIHTHFCTFMTACTITLSL